MTTDWAAAGGIPTESLLMSFIQLFLNATVLIAVAVVLTAVAISRFLAVARLHRLAQVVRELGESDQATDLRARFMDAVSTRLHAIDATFTDRHRNAGKHHLRIFLLGSYVAVAGIAGFLIWTGWTAVQSILPTTARAVVTAGLQGLSSGAASVAIAGLIIIAVSTSLGFVLYACVFVLERARAMREVLSGASEPQEPRAFGRYDITVSSIGLFAPVLTIVFLVQVFGAQGQLGEGRALVSQAYQRVAKVIHNDTTLSMPIAARVESTTNEILALPELDGEETAMMRAAMVDHYFRQPRALSTRVEAHAVAHMLRATMSDPRLGSEGVAIIATVGAYTRREWKGRRTALENQISDVLGPMHLDHMDDSELSEQMFPDWMSRAEVTDEQQAIDQLGRGELQGFLEFMSRDYFGRLRWNQSVVRAFPEWPEYRPNLIGTTDQQDALWKWVRDNEKQLAWSATEATFKIRAE